MLIENRKIPKGLSYPLRASLLETTLSSLSIAPETHLIQGGGSKLFECLFWPPNPNVAGERLYIRTSAVPNSRISEARTLIESSVIPEFIAWLLGILKLAPDSTLRRVEQYFERSLP